MPIQPLLKGSGLGAENVERLRCAYEAALHALYLVDRNDPIAEIVARKIIEISKDGGEPADIAERTVKSFGIHLISSWPRKWDKVRPIFDGMDRVFCSSSLARCSRERLGVTGHCRQYQRSEGRSWPDLRFDDLARKGRA